MHPGVDSSTGGRHRGGSGGVTGLPSGCPRCELLSPSLAVTQVLPELRLVPVWIGEGAPGWGGVGIVCHGDPGVVLV